ncbi:hypothetical protein [Streptomyces chartreusis]|uniref:hypothetical protein n=1 Tax=Streptomyces chartreusis TaxID=1969 RepID=UPI0004CC0FDD
MNNEIAQSAPSVVLRVPVQGPAVDRSPATPAPLDAEPAGAEANWEMPWTLIGHGAKGVLDAWLSSRA